ncbi:MAG: hypothetical protein HC862_25175 [Scytonema sp. RU_4_4]|nr:hypothetical protein [Scytonema sp. RU_4_4]NJR75856.1 hypothetical protein [Scytonema sp. CRU_2_7]
MLIYRGDGKGKPVSEPCTLYGKKKDMLLGSLNLIKGDSSWDDKFLDAEILVDINGKYEVIGYIHDYLWSSQQPKALHSEDYPFVLIRSKQKDELDSILESVPEINLTSCTHLQPGEKNILAENIESDVFQLKDSTLKNLGGTIFNWVQVFDSLNQILAMITWDFQGKFPYDVFDLKLVKEKTTTSGYRTPVDANKDQKIRVSSRQKELIRFLPAGIYEYQPPKDLQCQLYQGEIPINFGNQVEIQSGQLCRLPISKLEEKK